AANWRPPADFKSRFLNGDPPQVQPGCAVEPWWFFQAISHSRGEVNAETAAKDHHKSRRNDGLEGGTTRRPRQQGLPLQHQMDPTRRRGRLYFIFRARFNASQS